MPLSQPPARIATQRRIMENSFADTCKLVSIVTTYNEWGEPVTTETESAAKACRFIPQMSFSTRQQKYVDASGTVQRIGAAVRLSVDEYENISTTGRVKITHVHGEALTTPLLFDVMGEPQLGLAFVHVGLQEVSR